MDFIMLATLFVVVLLQIIILIRQQKNGKLVSDFIAQRNKNYQERNADRQDRFRDRNNNGNRQNRPPRTEQEFKPRTPQAPAPASAPEGAGEGAVDNMEKSLRDINLKLKNAERDQEAARRKFQDNGTPGGNRDQSRRRPHHDRDGSRGSRDGGSRGGRDENRDQRRGGGDRDRNSRSNWRDRNQDRPYQEERSGEPTDADVQTTNLPAMEADTGAITAPAAQVAAPELNASDFNSDNTEHGRKFMVKRRLLKDDLPGESEGSSSDAPSAPSDAAMDSSIDKPAGDAEISFGRR